MITRILTNAEFRKISDENGNLLPHIKTWMMTNLTSTSGWWPFIGSVPIAVEFETMFNQMELDFDSIADQTLFEQQWL